MIWNSWPDFFAMGGYALYVWGSVLVVVGTIAGELLALRWRRAAIFATLSAEKIVHKKHPEGGK